MKPHSFLFLGLLLLCLPQAAWSADGPEASAKVGVLGSASHLVFEGNKTFPGQRLHHGLRMHGDWLQAAHPEAPLADYVQTTRAALLRGYQRAGFPQVQITETRWLSDPPRLLCVISEGQRYMAGPVIVTGAQAVPAAQIIAKLTTKEKKKTADSFLPKDKPEEETNPPAVAVKSETTVPGLSIKTKTGEIADADSKSIAWEIGKPAALDARRPVELKEQVLKQLAQAGRMQAKVEVKTVLDEATHTAALHVDILSEGPPAVLAGISCTGLKRDSEAALLKYLGLEKGRPFMSGLVQEIENRLLSSARYTSYKVTATPRQKDEPEMDLKLELVEMPEAPKLGEPLNATCETLLKARDWLNDLLRSGSEDVVLTLELQPSSGQGGELGLIYNSQRGLQVTLTVYDDAAGRKNPRRCTLRYTREEVTAFFSAHDGAAREWLRQPHGGDMGASLFVTIDTGEIKDNRTVGTLYFGGSLKPKAGKELLELVLTLKPAAALLNSVKYASDWEHKDGLMVMKTETADGQGKYGAVIEEATGRLREISNGKGSWDKAHKEFSRFRLTTAKGAWDKATQELETQTAGLANNYEADAGLGSWAGWLTAAFLNSGLGKTAALPPEETARRIAAARDFGRRLGISVPEFFSAFDTGGDSFFVPDTPEKPRVTKATTAMIAQLGLTVVDSLVSEGSWPWLLAREVYYNTTGHTEYTGRILQQVRQDPQLGPVGCYFAAVLLDWTLPASAGDFRELALQKMTAADFRKDWGLLVESSTERQRTTLTELLAKVRKDGPNAETDLLREMFGTAETGGKISLNPGLEAFLKELRREPSRPLAEAVSVAMDRVWDETLSKILRDKLTPKGGDGKPVDAARVAAVVGGTEVTRRELALAKEVFRQKAATAKAGNTEAEAEQAALKAQIDIALVHAAFKAMGNTLKPEQLDEDVKQFVALKYKGSQARFLEQLTKEGYTMDEYRMMREKLIVFNLMRQKIFGMAPAPTEQEIARQMELNNAPPERQVKLRTLSLPKVSGGNDEAQHRKLADDLIARLKAGEDFGALAKKHSTDSRAADGGVRDWMKPEEFSQPISDALGKMKPGEVSGVVDIGSAWIIVKFDDERTLTQSPEEKRKAVTAALQQQKAKEFYEAWLNNVRGKIKVQIVPEPEAKAGK